MDSDTRNWQDESNEDIQLPESIIDDPLAELATQIALAYEAIERGCGSFCSACTCIGYHIPCEDGVCELCGDCEFIHKLCTTCGSSRPIELYLVGSKECKFCQNSPPIRIIPTKDNLRPRAEKDIQPVYDVYYDRSTEARLVLRELSE